jgi:hypothetical protein
MRKTAATLALLAPHRDLGPTAGSPLGRIASPSATANRACQITRREIGTLEPMRCGSHPGPTNTVRVLQGEHIACILADFVEKPTDNVR